jgi:tryptophanyl-tRNA synthetase
VEILVETLRPVRERNAELSADPSTVRDILRRSAEEITPIARRTVDAAKRAMGVGSSA